MLFDHLEQEQLLFNVNFRESVGGDVAYRGEMVVLPGEVGDAQGRRKPPKAVIKGAVALANGEQFKLLAGSLDLLQQLEQIGDLYKNALTPATVGVFFIVNLEQPLVIDLNGTKVIGIPMTDGMTWTELTDLVGLEKADFKGQSAGQKVVTVYEALLTLKPKYPAVSYAESLAYLNEATRVSRGAI